MDTERLRGVLSEFMRTSDLDCMLRFDSCVTIDQDVSLKYERIDRYRVILLLNDDLKRLQTFCIKHDISLWLGSDKLCIGFNYRGNMRLSAYSVPQPAHQASLISDRNNNSVYSEISDLGSQEDRIEPDHHLDVHGGVD